MKPENILYKVQPGYSESLAFSRLHSDQSLQVKLGDFGNAVKTQHVHYYFSDYEIQSLQYRAPEVVHAPLSARSFSLHVFLTCKVALGVGITPRIDVWSLGSTLFCILFQKSLFDVTTRESLIARMTSLLGISI